MTTSNYYLGPCQILFKGADLGKTEGGVKVAAAQTTVAPVPDGRSRPAAPAPMIKQHTSCSEPPSSICGMLPSADRLYKSLSADSFRFGCQ